MKNKAIVAALTENYVPGLNAMLKSFFTFNKFEGDIIIYKLNDFKINLPYSNIKTINLFNYKTDINYKVTHSTFNKDYNANSRIEIFKLDYDSIIFIDSDIIFKRSIEEILNLNEGLYACNTSDTHLKSMNRENYFDAGFLIINKKYLNNSIYEELKKFSFSRKWQDEEEMLNEFFKKEVILLPKKYNMLSHEITPEKLEDASIIQYVGEVKPWQGNSISECFNAFTISEVLNNNKNGLILLQKLKRLYEKYK